MLKESKKEREKKHKYYMNVLNTQEQNQPQNSMKQSKSAVTESEAKEGKDQKAVTGDASGATIEKAGARKPQTTALERRLQVLGGTRDQIQTINYLIAKLMSNAGISKEDMSDKIELLKNVEITFHELAEKRLIYNHKDKERLSQAEKDMNQKRKDQRTKVRQAQQMKIMEDKKKLIQDKQAKRD